MKWLSITDSLPGDACPRCDRGELYVPSPDGRAHAGRSSTSGARIAQRLSRHASIAAHYDDPIGVISQ